MNITKYTKILLPIVLAILQVTLMPLLGIKGVYPNLLVIGVTFVVLFGEENDAFWFAVISGLILDLLSPLPFGLNTLLLVLLALIFGFLKKSLPELNLLLVVTLIFVNTFIVSSILNLVTQHFSIYLLLFESIYAAVLGLGGFAYLNTRYKRSQVIKLGNE